VIRLIIAGGRDFVSSESDIEKLYGTNWNIMCHTMELWRSQFGMPNFVLCGMALGADLMGKHWADCANIEVLKYPAAWRVDGEYNPLAGIERNTEMADNATHLIAFWDGKSTGTADMIKKARNRGLHVTVIYYNRPKPIKTLF